MLCWKLILKNVVMLNFIKIHWFGLIAAILGLLFLVLFVLIAVSPRQDQLGRGFIPCTQNMVMQMLRCTENKFWCMTKAVARNTLCDIGVVKKGVKLWLEGAEPTPWASYLFEPVLEIHENGDMHEDLIRFYEQNNNLNTDMQNLDQARLELERKENENFEK